MQHTAAPPAGQPPYRGSPPTSGMSADESALLAVVRADPADDLARLVYADYLDDTGDPDRAALIRLQVELSRLSYPRSGRARNNQAGRCRELRAEARRLSGLFGRGTPAAVRRTADARGDCVAVGDKPYRLAWRRGFADAVWLSAAAFWGGGECRECGGQRTVRSLHDGRSLPCPVCRGTGRGTALARRLFERFPITRVVLTDRTPERAMFGPRCDWLRADGGPDDPHRIHPAVYDRLVGRRDRNGRRYRRREVAHDALSAACMAWARDLVGLPFIPSTGFHR